jgi:hypothetical protein
LNCNEGDIIIKQKNRTAEINFVKVIGENNVILTKEPSIESLLEYHINKSNESLNNLSSGKFNNNLKVFLDIL